MPAKNCFHWILCLLMASSAPASSTPLYPATESFVQETADSFGPDDGLPHRVVHAIQSLSDGSVLAATERGLARFDQHRWQPAALQPDFTVRRIAVSGPTLWLAGENALAQVQNNTLKRVPVPQNVTITALYSFQESLLVGTEQGLWVASLKEIKPIKHSPEHILSLARSGDRLLVGSRNGLYSSTLSAHPDRWRFESLYPHGNGYGWAPFDVTALAGSAETFWFGCANGAGRYAHGHWQLFTGLEGLPYDHFTCAKMVKDSIIWFGTERGAVRFDGQRWAYRASRRWLPNDKIHDLSVAADGAVWFATDNGVGRIRALVLTLADKADFYEKAIADRHQRMGFVVRCRLRKEGDLRNTWINHTDNDGLYTAMYGASQAFRYSVSRQPEAKRQADRVLRALKQLTDVTGLPGFPARSMVPVDWDPDPNLSLMPEYNRRMQAADPLWKQIYPRWPKSVNGKYLWKCDTSSDELCGHYFFYGVYFDLVAETEEDRALVRSQVRSITDHIVENGFRLIDHDGLPTRWANWSPEYVNGVDGWADRGLQSMELLSFLTVAWHITGDERYLQVKKQLCEQHDYHINAILGRAVFPPNLVVPWDNNLAFLSYYGLLKYEQDPALLKLWQASIERTWLFASRQNDPFFTFVYLAFKPEENSPLLEAALPDLERARAKAVQTLQRIPLSLLGWEMKNSHRLDVVQDLTPGQKAGYGWLRSGDAVAIDERCHIRINSDHFYLDHEQGGGCTEYEGTVYLLPYYLALHHRRLVGK